MITYSIIQKSQIKSVRRIDAEYFQPKYLELEKKIYSTNSFRLWGNIEGRFITGPFGSEFGVENYTSETQYRYVRGKDVKEFFLLDDDNVYIPEKDYERLKKYSLKGSDILVSVVGTLGNTAIVDGSVTPAIFSCKSTVFRTNSINPYYFITYLNSRYGYELLERSVRGAVQTGLNIDDLKSLPVFIPSQMVQESIASSVLDAKHEHDRSKILYSQAENLLLEKLGLKDFKLEEKLSYVVNLSDVKSAHRADSEYFQPKYDKIEEILNRFRRERLEDMSSLISYGTVPTSPYAEKGGVSYIKGENLRDCFIDYTKLVYLETESTKLLPPKFYLKEGDIIISQMGTVGRTGLVTKQEEGWLFASFTIRVRLKEKSKAILNPLFVTLFIENISRPYYLLRRISQASVRQNTDLPTIKDLKVPILPKPTQDKIADLVYRSHQARKKAKDLLDRAKREVEEFIEKE